MIGFEAGEEMYFSHGHYHTPIAGDAPEWEGHLFGDRGLTTVEI
jgi:hypothetical protein